jgi:hypothetical protein
MTNDLWPFNAQPSPEGVAARVIPSASHRPLSSVKARVPMVSPEAIPGRRYSLALWSPEVRMALAARATVEKNGAHSRAAPISSSTTMSST